ncbi:YutD family protein [Streptococcus phocae]|uniref:Transcriptional regulator n=1 Tax=Streptococcus phocae TaxID=119224 RepID=A0A0P6SE79_9STRE|nr:YutD family protein [Streptococcus phocae]KPJ22455.1 transcriptional regulator [Streptococcus phocae]
MKKEISPEMYNYNKFPGPEFVHFDNHVKAADIDLLLLENEKNAFNTTSFSQRFTDILLKYDYIVGDWGNEQLRLKGFYKDKNDVKKTSRISRLEDYIKEFCNFGCAYFVLENPTPKEIVYEEERPPRRRRSSKANRRKPQQGQGKDSKGPVVNVKSKKVTKESMLEKQTFVSKKRKESSKPAAKPKRSQPTQQPAKGKSDHFIIRKKDN